MILEFPYIYAKELREIIEKEFNGTVDWNSLGKLINIFNEKQFPREPNKSTIITVLMYKLGTKFHFN